MFAVKKSLQQCHRHEDLLKSLQNNVKAKQNRGNETVLLQSDHNVSYVYIVYISS